MSWIISVVGFLRLILQADGSVGLAMDLKEVAVEFQDRLFTDSALIKPGVH